MKLFLAALAASAIQQAPSPAKPGQLKPYAEVITAEAKTQEGLFKVHQVGEKYYFELPETALGKDMLWQAQEVEIPYTLGSIGPQDSRLVRWTRRNDKIFLNGVDTTLRSVEDNIGQAVRAMTPVAVIAAFNVETEGPNKAAVIDITDFLVSDPPDLTIGPSWNGQLDRNRSYVSKVKAFPQNIEMRALLTFKINRAETLPGTMSSSAPPVGPNASILMHYSFVLLPEKQMMPRYRDPRVGYFGHLVEEYGGPENRSVRREIISRYRLEKKDPAAEVSEPVNPIIFYLGREVPKQWRPYAIKAVEAWQPAFEQAGFKNAIVCREIPADDPDWDPEDARHSMIRWLPASVENAFGLRIGDPRTGEIISGQVLFFHNFLQFCQNMYFAQVSPLDPDARRLPFDEKLTGKLVQYILTHEVGHAIGLEHNMKASSSVTIAQLRDPAFVREHDIAPSIMDYARFNYVAQPGDGVPLERKIGAYDHFAIEWGYKPCPSAQTPAAEKPYLDAIASRQLTMPELRFGNYINPMDPEEGTEDISNDPLTAIRLGTLNLRRAAKLLIPATRKAGEDYTQLKLTYDMLVYQRRMELENIIRLVGGVNAAGHRAQVGGEVFNPVPASKQREAVKYLCGAEGMAPAELVSAEISRRLFATGAVQRAIGWQSVILFSLFNESRIQRLLDAGASDSKAYSVSMLLEDVQNGVWRELAAARPKIDGYQRQFQRNYLATMDGKLNGITATKTDLLPLGRASLRSLARRIDKAIPFAGDTITATHLADCRRQIEKILNGTSPGVTIPLTRAPGTSAFAATSCWSLPSSGG